MSLVSKLKALITYANSITSKEDTTVGDAVKSLADGYGGSNSIPENFCPGPLSSSGIINYAITSPFYPTNGGDIISVFVSESSSSTYFLCEYDSDKNFIDYWTIKGSRALTLDSGVSYIRVTLDYSIIGENKSYIKNTTQNIYYYKDF